MPHNYEKSEEPTWSSRYKEEQERKAKEKEKQSGCQVM